MAPEQALVAGAIDAARLLRLDNEIGSVEAGKRADLRQQPRTLTHRPVASYAQPW
jgi:cytosine/adenosine deaminase-related metal-dependent hydrolase